MSHDTFLGWFTPITKNIFPHILWRYPAIQRVLVLSGQLFWRHPNTTEMNGISFVALPALKKYISKKWTTFLSRDNVLLTVGNPQTSLWRVFIGSLMTEERFPIKSADSMLTNGFAPAKITTKVLWLNIKWGELHCSVWLLYDSSFCFVCILPW